jgi:small ubiquitin-related modifier
MTETQGLTAESWWNVDLSNKDEKRGATELVRRCVRMHGWTMDFAVKVLEGYRVFMDSKKYLQDWDATRVSPSLPVDLMWHAHILDVKNYIADCQLLVGELVGHDPDGGVDQEARKERIKTMKGYLVTRLGGDYDKSVWNFGPEDTTENRGVKRACEEEGCMSPQNVIPQEYPEPVTIRIRDQIGEETFFKCKRTTEMIKIFDAYAQRMGVSRRSLRFLLNGERVEPDQTPNSLDMYDDDQLDVMLEMGGC